MAFRIGWSIVLALGIASPTLADTVWLNPKGVENLAQIQAWLGGVRVFEHTEPSGNKVYYLRGRIIPHPTNDVDVTDGGQGTEVTFEAWSRPPGAKPSDPITNFSAPFNLPLAYVARIDHEVDGIVDFRLMFSDRDRLDRSSKPLWLKVLTPLNRLLENPPEGTVDINFDGSSPPAEPPAIADRVRLQGWVVRYLTDPVPGATPVVPPATQEVTLPDGRVVTAAVSTQRWDLLDPIDLNVGIERTVQELLAGLARESYYRGHRNDISDQDLIDAARHSLRFICQLAVVSAPDTFQPNGASASLSGQPLRRRLYRDTGLVARGAVMGVLETAAPGSMVPGDYTAETRSRIQAEIAAHPDPIERARFEKQFAPLFRLQACRNCEMVCDPAVGHICPRALAPEARLEVSPTRVAHEALSIMIESPEWWAVHGNSRGSREMPDTDRLTRAVLDLSALPASRGGVLYPDTRRADTPHYMEVRANVAPLLLVRFLRPLAPLPVPGQAGQVQDPTSFFPTDPRQRQDLENRLKVSSRSFAAELSRLLTDHDPARRDAARRALQEAAQIKGDPLVNRRTVENLLAVASAQIAVEGPSEESTAGTELEPAPGSGAPGSGAPGEEQPSTELNGTGWSTFNGGEMDRVDGLALHRGEVQQYVRARRKHAVRVLMILARLSARSDSPDERDLGRYVLSRLTDLRESIAEGRASQGEKSLIGVLNRLRRNPEQTLQQEAAFLNHQLRDELQERTREVEDEVEQLRADLEAALREGRQRDARRLEQERENCRRRLERLARLGQK